MIKVRLHGTPDEIEVFVNMVRQLEQFSILNVLSESDLYKDRGKSQYSRLYLDVEMYPEFQTASKQSNMTDSAINIGNLLRLKSP